MKKVLIVGPTEFKGGIETYVKNLLEILGESFKFSILQFREQSLADAGFFRKHGISIIKHVIPGDILSKLTFRDQLAMRSIFKYGKFDIVHINENSPAGYKLAKAAIECGAQVIYQSHNSYAVSLSHKKVSKFVIKPLRDFQRFRLKRLNVRRVAVSDVSAKWMFGTTSNVFYIWNSVDSSKFRFNEENRRKIRNSLKIPLNANVGIFIGRIAKQKNYERTVRIAVHALSDGVLDRFIFVGDGPDMGLLKKIINDLPSSIQQSFFVVGAQKKVSDWYSTADVMLMPSLYEGLPFGVVEAQTNGLPVVLSDAITHQVECTDILTYEGLSSSDLVWLSDLSEAITGDCRRKREIYADQVNESRFSKKNFEISVKKLYGIC